MQKSLKHIESLFINTHFDELVAARDRAKSAETSDTTLGEGERIQILAATGAKSIDELIQGAQVVKRLKRAAPLYLPVSVVCLRFRLIKSRWINFQVAFVTTSVDECNRLCISRPDIALLGIDNAGRHYLVSQQATKCKRVAA